MSITLDRPIRKELPHELVMKCISHANYETILKCKVVCKNWKTNINNTVLKNIDWNFIIDSKRKIKKLDEEIQFVKDLFDIASTANLFTQMMGFFQAIAIFL